MHPSINQISVTTQPVLYQKLSSSTWIQILELCLQKEGQFRVQSFSLDILFSFRKQCW